MKKIFLAFVLTITMSTMIGSTAFAGSSSGGNSSSSSSSSGSSSSSSKGSSTEATKGNVNTDSVAVAIVGAGGKVSKVNLTQYVQQVNHSVVSVVTKSVTGGTNAGEAVSALMSTPASAIFKATINALGSDVKLVNTGGYKVATTTTDASGKKIASVGKIKGITKYAFVILTAVNADGTVEIVEGIVDPVTLQVMGAFQGTPKTVSVSVIVAK